MTQRAGPFWDSVEGRLPRAAAGLVDSDERTIATAAATARVTAPDEARAAL
jgi:hypothetical protein